MSFLLAAFIAFFYVLVGAWLLLGAFRAVSWLRRKMRRRTV